MKDIAVQLLSALLLGQHYLQTSNASKLSFCLKRLPHQPVYNNCIDKNTSWDYLTHGSQSWMFLNTIAKDIHFDAGTLGKRNKKMGMNGKAAKLPFCLGPTATFHGSISPGLTCGNAVSPQQKSQCQTSA